MPVPIGLFIPLNLTSPKPMEFSGSKIPNIIIKDIFADNDINKA